MPHRPSLAAVLAVGLLSASTVTSAQAQTGRKQPQGKVSPQLIQAFDANGNGKLDPDEQQAASQYLKQMQQQIQAAGGQGAGGRPGAGRGPGGQMRPGGPIGAGGPGGGQGMGMSPQMQQQLTQKFDANGNGVLDPNEQQAAMQHMQQMQAAGGQGMGGQGMGGRRGPGGPMGPGAGQGMGMSPQMQQQLTQKFDANGNGVLDPNEQQAAMQYVQQMQAAGGQGGMRPGAGRGPGGAGRPGAGGPGGQAGGMNPQMQQQLLQNFDANSNGQLDPTEKQAALQYVQQMQQQLQAAGGAAGTKK